MATAKGTAVHQQRGFAAQDRSRARDGHINLHKEQEDLGKGQEDLSKGQQEVQPLLHIQLTLCVSPTVPCPGLPAPCACSSALSRARLRACAASPALHFSCSQLLLECCSCNPGPRHRETGSAPAAGEGARSQGFKSSNPHPGAPQFPESRCAAAARKTTLTSTTPLSSSSCRSARVYSSYRMVLAGRWRRAADSLSTRSTAVGYWDRPCARGSKMPWLVHLPVRLSFCTSSIVTVSYRRSCCVSSHGMIVGNRQAGASSSSCRAHPQACKGAEYRRAGKGEGRRLSYAYRHVA